MNLRIKLLTEQNKYFEEICEWNYMWWGLERGREKVAEYIGRCLNKKIPLTYIAVDGDDEKVVGMYQIVMNDDVNIRPDYYPWVANVFVKETYRNRGICDKLMKHAQCVFQELGYSKVYLYSEHEGLYEKYGWKLIETVTNFDGAYNRIFEYNVH